MMDTTSLRYDLYNLGEHALIYKARLINLHEHADFNDVIQCLKAYCIGLKLRSHSL